MISKHKFNSVFTDGRKLFTKNLIRGVSVYEEELIVQHGEEYRTWNPKRSKLSTMILKGAKNFPFKEDSKILYLGAGSGTTASHISDIVINGEIYCVEFSPRSFRDLFFLSEKRKNLFPILENANFPERYEKIVGNVEVIYQDVAQRNQVEIFLKNRIFLKNGTGIIMVKARSIDSSVNAKNVFNDVRKKLAKEVKIIEEIDLMPFEREHRAFIVKT